MFGKVKSFFSTDIGIDLGTANSLVYMKDRGIVLREPSVVAIQAGTKRVLAVGLEAKKMIGVTPRNIVAIRPMKSGVISDFDITEAMLRYFINKVCPKRFYSRYSKPRLVVAVPSGITDVEKRAVEEAAHDAGAGEVFLIEEPMAAAIGVGLPVDEPAGSMIVDIGGGTCEVAIISLSGIVHSFSARAAGGDAMDEAIISYIKNTYKLMIGERTAEQIKVGIGSAFPMAEETSMEIKGLDVISGLPKTMTVTSEEIRGALKGTVQLIVDAVKSTLERVEPELAGDLVDRGLVLSGGSSQLRGLDKLLAQQTGLPVMLADDPISAVAEGTGMVIDNIEILAQNKRAQ
ncbi:MAG: rod shape-determining protein [Kiritimatiellae bacterium]|nr:rod shape-determining protein [Kiritimatiellia bacterium]